MSITVGIHFLKDFFSPLFGRVLTLPTQCTSKHVVDRLSKSNNICTDNMELNFKMKENIDIFWLEKSHVWYMVSSININIIVGFCSKSQHTVFTGKGFCIHVSYKTDSKILAIHSDKCFILILAIVSNYSC